MTEADEKLSNQICDYWCNFVKSGNPNGDGASGMDSLRLGEPRCPDAGC